MHSDAQCSSFSERAQIKVSSPDQTSENERVQRERERQSFHLVSLSHGWGGLKGVRENAGRRGAHKSFNGSQIRVGDLRETLFPSSSPPPRWSKKVTKKFQSVFSFLSLSLFTLYTPPLFSLSLSFHSLISSTLTFSLSLCMSLFLYPFYSHCL